MDDIDYSLEPKYRNMEGGKTEPPPPPAFKVITITIKPDEQETEKINTDKNGLRENGASEAEQ